MKTIEISIKGITKTCVQINGESYQVFDYPFFLPASLYWLKTIIIQMKRSKMMQKPTSKDQHDIDQFTQEVAIEDGKISLQAIIEK